MPLQDVSTGISIRIGNHSHSVNPHSFARSIPSADSCAKVQQLFHTTKYFMLNNVNTENQYVTEFTGIISTFQGNNLTEINNLDRSSIQLKSYFRTLIRQDKSEATSRWVPEFNFSEIKTWWTGSDGLGDTVQIIWIDLSII